MTTEKITVSETGIQKNHESTNSQDKKITAPEGTRYFGD